jgi:hypothetical protein
LESITSSEWLPSTKIILEKNFLLICQHNNYSKLDLCSEESDSKCASEELSNDSNELNRLIGFYNKITVQKSLLSLNFNLIPTGHVSGCSKRRAVFINKLPKTEATYQLTELYLN